MTDEAAIRARHHPHPSVDPTVSYCCDCEQLGFEGQPDRDTTQWPCDAAELLRLLDEARAHIEQLEAVRRRERDELLTRIERLTAVIALHNKTPTGLTRECLPGCIACDILTDEVHRE